MSSNNSYDASEIVRSMHGLPHLNKNLQRESSQFNVTYDSGINSYVISLFPLPIMIGSNLCNCNSFYFDVVTALS